MQNDFLIELLNKHEDLKALYLKYSEVGLIREFDEREWGLIAEQNFDAPISGDHNIRTFTDWFKSGMHIGHCDWTAQQLSYSYDDVDLVDGKVVYFKGTKGSPNGGHKWLENSKYIIDTSLLLVIDKKIKDEMGYVEERRYPQSLLRQNRIYKSRKDWTRDSDLRRRK